MIIRVHLFSYYCFVKYYNYPINKYVKQLFRFEQRLALLSNRWYSRICIFWTNSFWKKVLKEFSTYSNVKLDPVVVPSKPAFAKYKLILTNCYQEEHFKRFPLLLYPHVKLLRSPTVAPTLSGTTRWCFYRSYSFSEQIVFEKKNV